MKVEQFQVMQEETREQYILHVIGELDLSVVPQLRAALEPVMNKADKALVLNLKQLKYIDSTGIGIIVSVLKLRDELKAPFFVKEVPSPIKRLFDLTGISRYLTEGTEAEA
ncbi:anti-sigma F factor antagonist [Paenibacillus sp. FSL H8-0548]|uniref:STAS domain-containing protein n=1 Tax=Paenibacillus sp. FSL H8-0548 TaxID=1920422 RepID=UPI00096D5F64|nr:STAS domain-containing protein [Paenibacillus sp. FSL H8-0548]OMF23451.1 anti-sigma F factor antagonist [Paenibacillus sp. FSL H8-0548]